MTGPSPAAFAAARLADPALAAADPVLDPDGRPLAHRGERAVVYQLCAADDRAWAVKCLPGADPALAARYARVAAEVRRGRLPFAVPCRFLADGVRAGVTVYPAAVLDWVEGVPLNAAVRERAGNPAALHALFRAWVRVAAGLRAAGAAHGELAHDNVLVAAGADPVRLVDYDSFHFPGLPPAADAGHPNYAHPAGAAPADRDRFPLLVVATALRAVTVLGRSVWDRFDTGDNLLFTAADFGDPAASPLFDLLLAAPDPTLRALVGALRGACAKPAAETPWADALLAPPAPDAPATRAPEAAPARPVWRQVLVPLALLAGVLMIAGGAVAGFLSALLAPPVEVVEAPADPPPAAAAPPAPRPAPKPAPAVAPVPAAGAVGFHKVWAKAVAGGPPHLAFTPDGAALLSRAAAPDRIDVFDAKTGAVRATLRGPGVPDGPFRVWEPEAGRVLLYGPGLAAPGAWDARTGARLADPLRGPLAPGGHIDAAGRLNGPARVELSPDGRYVFAANLGGDDGRGRAPHLLTEVATRRIVRAGLWGAGDVRFTADGARLLVAEAGGRTCWVRLPDGRVEAEWVYDASPAGGRIHGLSADGGVAVLRAAHGGAPGTFVADGKTGQLLRRVETAFLADALALSPDGRRLLGVGPDAAAELTDARTGAVLVRSPLGTRPEAVGAVALAPDARALAVYDAAARELTYYARRGAVPESAAPVPEPVAAAPPAPPDFPQFPPPAPRPPAFPQPAPRPAPPQPMAELPPIGLPERVAPPPPALRARWTAPAPAGLQANGMPQPPLYAPDGQTIVLSGGADGTVLTFKAATGAPGPVFDGHKGPGGTYWLAPFADKVTSRGFDARLATWEAATGRPAADLRFADLPPVPRGHAGMAHAVSPTGRYTAVARRDGVREPGPLRVLDTTTGKDVVTAEWGASNVGGHLFFTRDEAKVFVLDGLGGATWYKLPSGEREARWAAGEGGRAEAARVQSVSADGRRMIYNGPLPGVPFAGVALIDGATGAVVAPLPGFPLQPGTGAALSPDGRVATVPGRDPNTLVWYTDLLATDGWRVLGRIAHPPGAQHEAAHARFSPDGKDVAVFFRGARQLAVFPVPAAGPAPVVLDRPPPLVGREPGGGLIARWAADVPVGATVADVLLDARGRVLVANSFSGLHTVVDPRTGAAAPVGPAGDPPRAVIPGGRGEAVGAGVREVPVLDSTLARRLDDPAALPQLPPVGDADTATYVRLSAGGEYLAAGRRFLGAAGGALPLRVAERATGKVLVSTEWGGGTVHFTRDGSRVLVAEHSGRCRWFKLPSGEADGGFDLPRGGAGRHPEVTDLSADGRLVGYNGPVISPNGAQSAVADAATGRPVRAFGPEFLYTSPVSLSADGRRAAVMRAVAVVGSEMTVEVVDVATGAAVGRATVTTRSRSVPTFRLTPDGRALLIHDYSSQRLHWFDLPPR